MVNIYPIRKENAGNRIPGIKAFLKRILKVPECQNVSNNEIIKPVTRKIIPVYRMQSVNSYIGLDMKNVIMVRI